MSNPLKNRVGNPITIKYEGGVKESKSETNEESHIKHIMKFLDVDRQTAILEIRRWA